MTKLNFPHYDVIIIGAGSIGAPTAFFLAKSGFKVLVIDKFPSVGQGSSKRAIGGIRATHSDPAKIRLCLRSIEIFSTWKELYGDDIDWYKGGYTFVAYREQEEKTLKELQIKQKAFGLNINWLNKHEFLEIVPDINPDGLLGGTYSPDDGSASPLLATHSFYRRALDQGAEFHFNESIEEIIISSGKIKGVKTNHLTYGTDVLINAAGPWAKQVAKLAEIEIPVEPDSHEAAITESVAHFLNPMVVDIRPQPGSSNFYFYQHSTGQIIFCITPKPNIWGFNVEETSEFLPMVAKRMIEVMPRLQNIRVRRTWRGLYPMTPDGFPIIGWANNVEGFLHAAGTCGQGFMLGPGMGELLQRFVSKSLTEQDHEILPYVAPDRDFSGQELLK
ncbi:MAG: sulfurtransferase [Chloroflexi bacterium HGW-Chloroflexi-2]|jgi:sarcosine oxidase subunit beta|nr:MAG: sulfurtransferase [Chloroflexi bacterium HGW-Chloroflexi-2]